MKTFFQFLQENIHINQFPSLAKVVQEIEKHEDMKDALAKMLTANPHRLYWWDQQINHGQLDVQRFIKKMIDAGYYNPDNTQNFMYVKHT